MFKSNTVNSCVLLGLMAIAPSTLAALATPGMPTGLQITENFNPGLEQGNYAVQNNTSSFLMGFGVSNPLSVASIGSFGNTFECGGNPLYCYGATTLNAGNWGTEAAYFDDALGELTFQTIYGDFSDNVELGETTINWYYSEDGALGPGDFEDFFLFSANVPASLALGILENGGDTVYFNQASLAPVPLPAAVWLFGSALLGLGMVKRKKA